MTANYADRDHDTKLTFAGAVLAYAEYKMTWPEIRDQFEEVAFGDVLVELGRHGLKYPSTVRPLEPRLLQALGGPR
jgi:hypothetical protein